MTPNELKARYGITAGWRYPSSGRGHYAWDIPAPRHAEIHSPVDGTVTDCNDGVPHGGGNFPNGPSNWITLVFEHPEHGSCTYYFQHLERGLGVKKGQRVSKGTYLGAVGLTGNTTGYHLHLSCGNYWGNGGNRYTYMSNNGALAVFPPDYETPDKEPEPEPIQEDDEMLIVTQGSRRMLLHGPHTTRLTKGSADAIVKSGVPAAAVTKEDFDSLSRAEGTYVNPEKRDA